MDALEVGIPGVVTGFHKGFEASLHQSADTAAQNRLLTEEVGFGLGAEVSLQDACPGTADAQSVGKTDVQSVAGGVLLHGNQAGNTLASLILAAHGVTGTLGGNHDDVDILGRLDAAKVDVEAVGKRQGLAGGQVGFDAVFVQGSLLLVVDEDHDNVGSLGRLGGGHDGHALSFRLCPALGAVVQTNNNVDAALLQVEGVGVALRAVADDGNGLARQLLKVAVLLIENTIHLNYLFSKI